MPTSPIDFRFPRSEPFRKLAVMTEENPYAPQAPEETHTAPGGMWWTESGWLIVKHGATLPMIDLNTGESGPDLVPAKRTRRSLIMLLFTRMLMLIGFWLISYFTRLPVPALIIVVGLRYGAKMFFQHLRYTRGLPPSEVVIVEYQNERTHGSRRRRASLRFVIAIVALVSFPIATVYMKSSSESAYLCVLGLCIGIVGGMGVWGIVDEPKAKSRSAPPGYLHLAPIHPQALVKLKALEEPRQQEPQAAPQILY